MPRKEKPTLVFQVDSREQLPYQFSAPDKSRFADGGTIVFKIDAGDYTVLLEGEELPVRIERKSINDYFGMCGREREREERKLERMSKYRSYLIIEADADEIRHGYERSLVPGLAALHSAYAWSIDYGISVIFAGHRRGGRDACQFHLERFAWWWLKGKENGISKDAEG